MTTKAQKLFRKLLDADPSRRMKLGTFRQKNVYFSNDRSKNVLTNILHHRRHNYLIT